MSIAGDAEDPSEDGSPQEPEDTPFTKAIGNVLVTGHQHQCSVVALLYRPRLTIERVATELGS